MSNYSKTTDFAAKDSLPSGDAAKIIRGSEFETEFDNISIAIATKADSASPTFTGTVTIDGLTVNGNTTLGNAATDTVTVTADIASNLIPSADNTHDLGASGAEWKDLYVDGVAYIDTVAGFATTENITFGDGDKAIFGASSDLQIYHSGTASHITENGSGSLFIDGTNLRLRSSAEEIYLEALSDGAVTLYYNNAAKLATTSLGIDITGTAEVDALSINGTTVTSTATELNLLDGITGILDEDNMASNSATALATQQSIKAYVDTQVATADALSEVLGNGNTTGGTDIAVGTGDDITFADNSKAIFGAGSDLQIYHDSANSLIEDSGTGNLLIRGSSNVDIQPSGGGSYMARFTASGAASLYHSGSSKLATTSTGIDVTGTLTADGLTVNSGTTNTTSFFESTDATADIIVADTNTSNVLRTNSGGLFINTGGTASTQGTGATPTAQFATNGDVSFYEDTGTTAKLFWDASAESLGIGTTSPASALDVVGTTKTDGLEVDLSGGGDVVVTGAATTNTGIFVRDPTATTYGAFFGYDDANTVVSIGGVTNSTKNAAISIARDTSNVGIGTSSPSRSLHINSGTVNVVAKFESSDSIAAVEFVDSDTTTNPNMGAVGDDLRFVTNNAEAMRIDSSGLVGIGTNSPSHKLDVNGNAQISAATGSGTLNLVSSENVLNAGQKIAFFGANRSTANEENAYIKSLMTSYSGGAGNGQLGHLTFGTSGSERVRIDSDGNVGIGTDSPSSNLHVREGSTSNLPTINIATKGVLESTAAATAFCGLSIISGATSGASILNFGDSDDEDVGRLLYAHSDNSLRINTSASEAMRIDSSGNVGIGNTGSSVKLTVNNDSNGQVLLGRQGAAQSGKMAWPLIIAQGDGDVGVEQFSGTQVYGFWYQNAGLSNPASETLGFNTNNNERMRIDSSGNVGIGKSNPSVRLDVDGSLMTSGVAYFHEGTSSTANAIEIGRNRSVDGAVFIDFTTAAAGADNDFRIIREAGLNGNAQFDNRGTGSLLFKTQNTERVRIDSSGNLLVGKTAASTTNTVGHELDNDGHAEHVIDGTTTAHALMLNRKSTDGTLVDFRKDNSAVGGIGVNESDLYIGTGDTTIRFADGADAVVPRGSAGVARDAAIGLGNSANRFKDLYLSGGAYLGGTAAANKLDDYEEGTWTPTFTRATTAPTLVTSGVSGRYTKIGRFVQATFFMQITSVTSVGAGTNLIGGLPFSAVFTEAPSLSLYRADVFSDSITGQFSSQNIGGTTIRITQLATNGVPTSVSSDPSTGYIIGQIIYEAS